jgi:hypothetical protein
LLEWKTKEMEKLTKSLDKKLAKALKDEAYKG